MKQKPKLAQTYLSRFATRRTGHDDIPGRYDRSRDMWVLDEPKSGTPIISFARDIAELQTKTEVRKERDDPGNVALLELTTKTSTTPERDDIRPDHMISHALELATKTKSQAERDD